MATSKTSQSASVSGVAKDDTLGHDGDFTFTVADLLANDGGSVKNVADHFVFGTTQADWNDQATYLTNHGITANADGTYTINSDGLDFQYMIQTGNKGTWSTANVDVTAPEPVDTHHAGDLLFSEDFDTYTNLDNNLTWDTVNLTNGPATGPSVGHSWAIMGDDNQWHGVTGEVVQGNLPDSIESTSGDFWLDTQNSPGGIDISNWFVDPTGGEFRLSFDLGIHDFGDGPKAETAQNAMLNVLVDGNLVDTIDYSEVLAKAGGVEQMGHFEYVVDGGDASAGHNISFVDVTPQVDGGNYVGFALDTIQVHDWII
jgi:hypothetical protein